MIKNRLILANFWESACGELARFERSRRKPLTKKWKQTRCSVINSYELRYA